MTGAATKATTAERLSSTLFIAGLAHGLVILGVTFKALPAPDSAELPSLNVTLVVDTAEVQEAADDARFLANRNQAGGGSAADGNRPTTTLAAAHPRTQLGDPRGADLTDAAPREQAPEADRLTTRDNPARQTRAEPKATDATAEAPQKAAALIRQQAPQTLSAELDLRAEQPDTDDASAPNAPSTRESAIAAYQVRWRQRVERVGTANFPASFLNGDPSIGRPTLEVAIDREGRLADIVVRTSSGDRSLDQAALNILRLAAPFEPLPEAVTAEPLRFAYEWEFSRGPGGR